MFLSTAVRAIRGISSSSTRTFCVSSAKWATLPSDPPTPQEMASSRMGIAGNPTDTEGEVWNTQLVTDRYVAYFSNTKNDGWLARQAMNDLFSHPIIPEPQISIEVLHCCRRMNDYALAVRYLECVHHSMYKEKSKIWPWYLQEIKPTLDELGVLTPEEMGYSKPEFFQPEPEDIDS